MKEMKEMKRYAAPMLMPTRGALERLEVELKWSLGRAGAAPGAGLV